MASAGCENNPTCNADREAMGERGVERYLPDLEVVWSLTQGDPTVCIAVLDGAVDAGHPCFEGALLKQLSLLSSADRARGLGLRHGTYTASLIFGQHHSVVRGVAPRCRGVLIPVFREWDDGGIVPCSQLDLARAISLAVAVGANVINISAGRLDNTGEPEPPLARAIRLCAEHGILIVAAAGNEGCACLHVPASSATVLAVGAMDAAGQPLEFSNWAESYASHGILAPGELVTGAASGGGIAAASGTSVATAIVSGVAGLLMSLQVRHGMTIDAQAVKSAILEGATRCAERPTADCRRALGGRLNLLRTVGLVSQGEIPAMSNPTLPNPPGQPPSAPADAGQTETQRVKTDLPPEPPPAPCRAVAERAEGPRAETAVPLRGPSQATGALVYVLGQIAYDFGSEARRDAFEQRDGETVRDRLALLDYLDQNPWEATGLIWTLEQEATPVYALQPSGPFARETHDRLRALYRSQLVEGVTQVSIPGLLGGSVTLMNGHEVPVVEPEIRGMFGWSIPALLREVLGERPPEGPDRDEYDRLAAEIADFLDRLYYGLANFGLASSERAINYAATNIHQVATVYKEAIKQNLKLDNIEKERSPICRPGSDCWDVKLTLFNPKQRYEQARVVYRLTVDVSEIIPVTVGKLRRWSVY